MGAELKSPAASDCPVVGGGVKCAPRAAAGRAGLKARSVLFLKRRKSSQEAGTLDPFLQMCVCVCAKLLQSSPSLCDTHG